MLLSIARENLNLPGPPFVDREYKNDVAFYSDAARITSTVLPFISLYRPAGKVISLTMNGVRTCKSLYSFSQAKHKGYALIELSMTVVTVAGSVFSFKAAMLFSTATDIVCSLKRCTEHLSEEEYLKLSKEVMMVVSHALYGAMIVSGGIELTIASLALKSILCFVEAIEEGQKEGHQIDAVAKVALGVIRGYQAYGYNSLRIAKVEQERRLKNERIKKIQRLKDKLAKEKRESNAKIANLTSRLQRKEEDLLLLKDQKKEFLVPLQGKLEFIESLRTKRCELESFDEHHPLASLPKAFMENKVVYIDDAGVKHDLGAHFSRMGGALVEGMNLCVIEEGENYVVEFRLNHVFREQLSDKIEVFEEVLKDKKFRNVIKDLRVEQRVQHFGKEVKEFYFNEKGGSIAFIENKRMLNSYDRVRVKILKEESNESLDTLSCILGVFDLEEALKVSTEEEIERMKLGHLFHTMCPRSALELERTEGFFTLPLAQLKEKMVEMDPSMEKYFEKFLENIKFEEIFPGRERLRIHGLVEEIEQQNGLVHLTRTMSNVKDTLTAFSRLHAILNIGLYSVEQRDRGSFEHIGLIYDDDRFSANDVVFTQLVNAQNDYSHLAYNCSGFRLLIDPNVVEFGTYQYHYDEFGSRRVYIGDVYIQRDGIFDFVRGENSNPRKSNEVMIKDFIPPKFILGVIAPNQEKREYLILLLVEGGLFTQEEAEEFVKVGKKVDKEYIERRRGRAS